MSTIEEQIKINMKKAFFDLIDQNVNSKNPDFNWITNLYEEIKFKLLSFLPNKNGSIYNRYNSIGNASNYQTPIISSIIDLNGSTDYVEIYVVYEGANGGFIDTSTGRCWFDGSLIS